MEREDTNLEFDEDQVDYDPSLKPREYDATGLDTDLEIDAEEAAENRPATDFGFDPDADGIDSTAIDLALAASNGAGRESRLGLVDFDFGRSGIARWSEPEPETAAAGIGQAQARVFDSARDRVLASYRLSPDCVISLVADGSVNFEAIETLLQRLRADLDEGVFDPD